MEASKIVRLVQRRIQEIEKIHNTYIQSNNLVSFVCVCICICVYEQNTQKGGIYSSTVFLLTKNK